MVTGGGTPPVGVGVRGRGEGGAEAGHVIRGGGLGPGRDPILGLILNRGVSLGRGHPPGLGRGHPNGQNHQLKMISPNLSHRSSHDLSRLEESQEAPDLDQDKN